MNMATQPLPDPAPDATAPPAEEPVKHRKASVIRSWPEHLQSLASTIVIAIFVIIFIVQAFQIPSGSMEDTLLVGDYVLVDKFAYAPPGQWHWLVPYDKLRRGDIVVFKWPVHPEQHFVKRLIGLPGDRIRLINGRVFINGELQREDYAVYKFSNHDYFRDEFPLHRGFPPGVTRAWMDELPRFTIENELVVPEDSYFMMGDNRDDSSDSRYWGFVPRENVVGKPLLIYFSMRHFDDDPLLVRADGKIGRFVDRLREWPTMARWGRVLRFVK
jgi:signal peptidase I